MCHFRCAVTVIYIARSSSPPTPVRTRPDLGVMRLVVREPVHMYKVCFDPAPTAVYLTQTKKRPLAEGRFEREVLPADA